MIAAAAVMGKEWRRLLRAPATPWILAAYLFFPALMAALPLRAGATAVNPMMAPGLAQQMIPLMGSQALANVATWQVLLLAVGAPWLAAGVIAAEVEDRTLDPLLAGGGGLIGVVVGKLLAVILFLWLIVLAGLPVFTLPFLVGGTQWLLMGRAVAVEVATVAGMAGLGVAISAFGRRSGSLAMTGLAIGLALTVGIGLVGNGATTLNSPYARDQIMIAAKMGIPVVTPTTAVAKWQYVDPLVGLNSALNQPGGQSLFGLPGAGSGPVLKSYRLWQVQVAAAGAVAVLGALVAWAALWVRLRWHWPGWLRLPRRKGVALNG